EIVDQRVVDSKSRAHRGLAFSKWIPCQCRSWPEQPFRFVFRECGLSHSRFRQKHATRIRHVVSRSTELFIPPVGELVPDTDTESKIAAELHGIFRVPCAEPAAETQLGRGRHDLEAGWAKRSLQKRGQTREIRYSQPARGRIFVVLQLLEPCAEVDLMDSA